MTSKTTRKLWIYRGKGDCLGYGELRSAGDFFEAQYRLLAVYPMITKDMLDSPNCFDVTCEDLPIELKDIGNGLTIDR